METHNTCQVHSAWVEGHIHVVVATVAFGMGINKAPLKTFWEAGHDLVKERDEYIFGNFVS